MITYINKFYSLTSIDNKLKAKEGKLFAIEILKPMIKKKDERKVRER